MPGRQWYVIAFFMVIVGAAVAGLVSYTRLRTLARELPQVVVPGEAELTFNRPGTYTIYFERQSVVNGRVYSTDDVAGLRVRLVSPSGAPISLTTPSVESNYSISGRAGTAVLSCTISEPGKYLLAAEYPSGAGGPEGVLAIGLGVPGQILMTVLLALAIGFAGFAAALITGAITFWRRRKARRIIAAQPRPATS